jgi:hypothetical protein
MTAPTDLAPRVVIADDQELVRTGFRLILTARGIDVVGEEPRPSKPSAACGPTSSSWTSACRTWTAWKLPAASSPRPQVAE